MSISSLRFASPVLLVVLVAGAGEAMAQRAGVDRGAGVRVPQPQHDHRDHERRDDHRALSDAVRRVERRTGGQVLSAERVPFDGRDVSRVKVVDASGRVRVYMDDPRAARSEPPRTRRDDD